MIIHIVNAEGNMAFIIRFLDNWIGGFALGDMRLIPVIEGIIQET